MTAVWGHTATPLSMRRSPSSVGVEGFLARIHADSLGWSETAYAVRGADVEQVRELADRYEQGTIYEWSPNHRPVIFTADLSRRIIGWKLTMPPARRADS
jgi:hypothetical protein